MNSVAITSLHASMSCCLSDCVILDQQTKNCALYFGAWKHGWHSSFSHVLSGLQQFPCSPPIKVFSPCTTHPEHCKLPFSSTSANSPAWNPSFHWLSAGVCIIFKAQCWHKSFSLWRDLQPYSSSPAHHTTPSLLCVKVQEACSLLQ